jgi:hypothetical protein
VPGLAPAAKQGGAFVAKALRSCQYPHVEPDIAVAEGTSRSGHERKVLKALPGPRFGLIRIIEVGCMTQ